MRKRLINQQDLPRRLFRLSLFFALLLLPMGAWAEEYDLWIGGTQVTSENKANVLGDGKVSFTPANDAVSPATPATLTLNDIDLEFISSVSYDAFIAMVDQDHPTLTVRLVGDNTLTIGDKACFFNGTSITFTTDTSNPGTLTINTGDNWGGALFIDNPSHDPINATYNNHLYLDVRDATSGLYYIRTLPCCDYNSYMGDENLIFQLQSHDQTPNADEELHYSIDYVDENRQDVDDGVFSSNGSEATFGGEVTLYGPCTVTFYTTAGGGTSEVITAYYLGLSTNAVRTTLGTSVAPPTIVPALGEALELIINETTSSGVNPVYDSTSGLITTSSTVTGEATCSVKIYCSAATTLGINVLNSTDETEKYELGDFTLTVREPGLFVAGVKVPTDNASDITGDNIEGTVSYDASKNELTLSDATITGQIVCSYDALTVHLVGYNTITPGDGVSPFVYSNPGTGTLTFTTNENPNSSRLVAEGVTSTGALGLGYTVSNTFETRTKEQGSMIGAGVEAEDGWKVVIFKDDWNAPNHTVIWNFKNYNLFICGVRVNSDNLDGGQSGISPYNPDTHTFPVSGPTQYAVKSGLEELIIEVNGVATIDASDYSTNLMPAISFEAMTGGPTSGTLKFVKGADADLASITLTPSDTHKAIEGFAVDDIIITAPLELKTPTSMSDILDATTVTIGNHEVYGIKVAGITVTDGNKDNVLGDNLPEGVSVGSVSYDDATHTLTLNNATIDMSEEYAYPIESTIENLVLDLKGESEITVNSSYYPYAYKYTGTSQAATLSLNQEAVGGATLRIGGVGYLANTFDGCEFSETWNGNDGETGWRYEESNGMYPKVTITFLQYYDMWVNDYQLTSDNIGAMEITCQFKPDTHTLKLDNYPNNGVFKSGMPELIVELSGQNNVKSFTYEGDGNGTLIFRAADPDAGANIEIENVDNNQETPVYGPAISSFNTVTVETPLKLLTPQDAPEDWSAYTNKIVIGINSYDLYVAGILVREDNASNVLSDDLTEEGSVASVSYDATSNTLTLNGASIIPDHETAGIVYEGEENLIIKLIGTNNTVKGVGGCPAIAYYGLLDTPPTLTFTKGDTQACSLQLEAQGETVIDAFTNISHDGLFMLNDEIVGVDVPSTYITTFTSTLLAGGTGTSDDPFLIKTKEDLADFAKYVNNGVITTEYVELNDDINCSELTGFTPIGNSTHPFTGTFTNSDNYTISNLNCTTAGADGYIGLFGVVGSNGATSVAGSVSNIKLNNCSFSGGKVGGAIAGYLSNGTINNCQVINSSVTTSSGDGPTSAGIAGESFGTITNCTVSGSTITATTSTGTYATTAGGVVGTNGGTISSCEVTGTTEHPTLICSINNDDGSDPNRQAGGIVGDCIDDASVTVIISGNSVKGVTTVDCEDSDGAAQAGAIIGRRNNNNITLTNNFYDYTVKAIIINGDDEDERTGYQQRGNGDFVYDEQTQTNVYTDITANNGAVMYTKKVTLPTAVAEGSVLGTEGTYYVDASVTDGILVAPGQTASVKVILESGYAIGSFTVTNATTSETITTTSETVGDNTTQYTFTMPDAPVTVTLAIARPLEITYASGQTWASYYATENLTVPDGLVAYIVTAVDKTNGTVTTSHVDYMPANQGVLLEKPSTTTATSGFMTSSYTGTTSTVSGNLLKGSVDAVDFSSISEGTPYVLYNNVFKRVTGGYITARRAYLVVSDTSLSRLTIVHDGTDTAVDTISVEETDSDWYTIDGRKLNGKPQRAGFYIKNGKKVFIKK